jgi:hypothetical protein
MDDIAAASVFRDDDAARALLENLRWPKGVVCVRNPGHKGVLKVGGSKRSHRWIIRLSRLPDGVPIRAIHRNRGHHV